MAPDEGELLWAGEALDEMTALDSITAELVELQLFVGLNFVEAAEVKGISDFPANRHWMFARAWLYRRSGGGASGAAKPPVL